MNNEVAGQNLSVVHDSRASSLAIITNEGNMNRLMQLATVMSKSVVTVPKHLHGNVGDCMAIAMQAANWGMSPFAVAQKTHIVNGTLGYEAQLVNAVVGESGAIIGTFKYEYKGEGAAMECRVGAVLRGEKAITWGEWLCFGLVTTRNSPLWKTNPKQQMGYLQVKNWSRAYAPAAILGVYSVDELEPVEMKDLNEAPAHEGKDGEKVTVILPDLTEDQLYKSCGDKVDSDGVITKMGHKGKIQSGDKKAEDLINALSTKYVLSDAIKEIINSWEPDAQ